MSEQQLVLMRMPLGPLGTNCYVIGDKAIGEAFIIDPATAEVLDALKKHDLKPVQKRKCLQPVAMAAFL